MSDAIDHPVKRKYNRKEVHTEDFNLAQKDDINLDEDIKHGESLVNIAGAAAIHKEYLAELAFMEEPVTVLIEENSRSDFPETHVPVQVNGKGAEVFYDGKWIAVGWLPINQELTIKRKYAEVLVRSISESVRTKHDDANVEKPRNTVTRRSSANYPMTVMVDANPRGREWLSRIRQGY